MIAEATRLEILMLTNAFYPRNVRNSFNTQCASFSVLCNYYWLKPISTVYHHAKLNIPLLVPLQRLSMTELG